MNIMWTVCVDCFCVKLNVNIFAVFVFIRTPEITRPGYIDLSLKWHHVSGGTLLTHSLSLTIEDTKNPKYVSNAFLNWLLMTSTLSVTCTIEWFRIS